MFRFYLRFLLCFAFVFPAFFYAIAPSNFYRQPYETYVSGDGFRFLADWVWDDDDTFDPKSVLENTVIFLKISHLESFFIQVHPLIEHAYILITHNGDESAPGKFWHLLKDPKIRAWFTINLEGDPHPKLHLIPLGIANRYTNPLAEDMLNKIKEKTIAKEHLLYFNLTIQNYLPERWQVFQLLGRTPFCYKSYRKRFDHYLIDLAASRFVLSPRGVGLDTHRLWETLYLGAYPIVKSSSLDPLYEGLPVIVVNDWTEITPAFLEQTYETMMQASFSFEKLTMEYWKKKVESYKSNP